LEIMAGTESLNLSDVLEQAEAAYRSPAGNLAAATDEGRARRAGHLSSFVRLSLDEPDTMRRMQEAAGKLRECSALGELLLKVLDDAVALTGADFGNVRLLDPVSGDLTIVTERGFGAELIGSIPVAVYDAPWWGKRAALDRAQTVIADVTTDPDCVRYREIAVAAGFRAVQSTPLADSSGRVFGTVSTHFRQPGSRPGRDLRMMDLYGDLVGEALARYLRPTPGGTALDLARDGEGPPGPGPGHEPAPPETALAGLADKIVRRLFAAGLSLASVQAIIGEGPAGDRVAACVDELDRGIRDIRAVMLALPEPRSASRIEPGP
jgi:hypothetical protein